jgi:hypothetical protein
MDSIIRRMAGPQLDRRHVDCLSHGEISSSESPSTFAPSAFPATTNPPLWEGIARLKAQSVAAEDDWAETG